MGFREFDVAEVVVVRNTDEEAFAVELGQMITKENVIDFQYSTTTVPGNFSPQVHYSAVLLIGKSLSVEP